MKRYIFIMLFAASSAVYGSEWAHNAIDLTHKYGDGSGVKVGITRHSQIPTRWMDQGAIQALPIFRVSTRLQSGQVEVIFKNPTYIGKHCGCSGGSFFIAFGVPFH